MVDSKTFKELVGELVDERIPEMDKIPSFEEIYGGEMANKLIKKLKSSGTIHNGVYEIVKQDNKVICKILLQFNDKNESVMLVQSKGKTLHLPGSWLYSLNNSNDTIIEFLIK